ncbi:MAG TPA: NrfD/PsrC family molybdoenzyme membrane anchor subunit [Polyangia bacterium]
MMDSTTTLPPALSFGEAAQMKVREHEDAFPVPVGTRSVPPGTTTAATVADLETPTYYGLPMLKEPVWKLAVPLYFWLGGAAGAASTLSFAARVLGGRALDPLARRARLVAAIGETVGAGLLTYDLGRPSRFYNMLRVFNPRSPMSVGSWVLSGSGAANTGALLLQNRRGFFGALGDLAGATGALLGMPLAGYTAVLLANTAVPVWNLGRRSLPLLFMASSVATAGSLLSLTAASERERVVVQRYAIAGKVGELAATAALHLEVRRASPRAARPLTRGLSGTLLTAATVLTATSLIGSLTAGRSRRRARNAAILGALGSLALRFAIHHAGKQSARDPRASFSSQRRAMQRQGIERQGIERQGMTSRASST